MNLFQKMQRYCHIWNNSVTLLLVLFLQHKLSFRFFFQTFLQLTTRSFTINTMQVTVSNNGTQWILDFGPDSVVLSVVDLHKNLTISSLEFQLAAWSLLLSQRQKVLNNHLPGVPITPNQQGTFEMRDEVLSCVGAQDTNTRGYEVSDLEDIEFSWEDPAVDVECLSTWNWYPIFPIHLWRFSDGGIDCYQPNNSWRWGRQGEFSSNNINTRVWASNRASQITEKTSIWDSTGKSAWNRIQDTVSLNFVFDTLYVFCVYK